MTLQASVIGLLDAMADAAGLLRCPLRPEALIETARQRTGLHDFGDMDFGEPLAHFLEAWMNEASLSVIGRMAAGWDALRFMCNLLRLRQEEHLTPMVLDERIDQPIFIIGLRRSGTTFLHRLMMIDPANRPPLVWQTIYLERQNE